MRKTKLTWRLRESDKNCPVLHILFRKYITSEKGKESFRLGTLEPILKRGVLEWSIGRHGQYVNQKSWKKKKKCS